LELIAHETSAGCANDNGNLKKDGWTNVMNALNECFNLNLNRDQIKNQKNFLRSLYADYKFLCDQSGFGWDNEKSIVTADEKTWEELIQAHPRRNFSKLKDKPFPIYELADRVFTGTYATGEVANGVLPPTEDPNIVATNKTKNNKVKSKKKRPQVSSSSSDDSSEDLAKPAESTSNSLTSSKRVRETKGSVVSKSINSLIGAINNASNSLASSNSGGTHTISGGHSGAPQNSPSAQALESLAQLFLNDIDDEDYIQFVIVLEDEKKASTFLSLVKTSTKKICRMWLDKEAASRS